jgi:tight adherence protein B
MILSSEFLPLAVMAGMTVLILFMFGFFGGDPGLRITSRRLTRAGGGGPLNKNSSPTLRRSTTDSTIPFLDNLIKSALPNPDRLRKRLDRTGRKITPGAYLLVSALLVILLFLIFRAAAHWGLPIALSAGIAMGLYIPHMFVNRMGNKRITAFLAAFPEAIDTICRGLRSGLPITECITTVGAEAADPIGIEFRRISDSVRMGRTLEDSMWDVEPRLDTQEFRFFIIALAIQRETGGNLAETLGNLGNLLRKRRQLRLKIRAMSSEARASAMIIGSLPFLMFALLYVMNNDYVMLLLTLEKGKMMLAAGLFWLSLGVFVMKQMVNFEI